MTAGLRSPSSLPVAIASLRERWGPSILRSASQMAGNLAIQPSPVPAEEAEKDRTDLLAALLDPALAVTPVVVGGELGSGQTTLALGLVARAQATGSIVVYVDGSRSFDPLDAVARGVRLDRLVLLAPTSCEEGLAMAGFLLASREVDLLILDPGPTEDAKRGSQGRRLQRLAALARRARTRLVLLEPPGSSPTAPWRHLGGLRLELIRRAWIRLGREVVGQRTEVWMEDRRSPPGRRFQLRILYADRADQAACLARDDLVTEVAVREPPERRRWGSSTGSLIGTSVGPSVGSSAGWRGGNHVHPPAPSRMASSPSPIGASPPGTILTLLPGGAGGPRRPAVERRTSC
jgi:hypothetical protein